MYRFTRTFVAVGVVALLSATGAAQAAFITINNAGFETPPLANGAFNLTVAGWTNSGTSGTFDPSSSHYPGGIVPEGENVAFSNAGDAVKISQVLSDNLTANTQYTLTMFVGNRLDVAFPGYRIELLAGGVVLAQDNNTLLPANGQFLLSTVSYFATPAAPQLGQPLQIRFSAFGAQPNFDDVKLEAIVIVIPEPATLGLMLLGLAALLARCRHR